MFYYLGDTIGPRKSAVDSVMTKIMSGWNKVKDFVSY